GHARRPRSRVRTHIALHPVEYVVRDLLDVLPPTRLGCERELELDVALGRSSGLVPELGEALLAEAILLEGTEGRPSALGHLHRQGAVEDGAVVDGGGEAKLLRVQPRGPGLGRAVLA